MVVDVSIGVVTRLTHAIRHLAQTGHSCDATSIMENIILESRL